MGEIKDLLSDNTLYSIYFEVFVCVNHAETQLHGSEVTSMKRSLLLLSIQNKVMTNRPIVKRNFVVLCNIGELYILPKKQKTNRKSKVKFGLNIFYFIDINLFVHMNQKEE